jgi:amino acid adenylation domain-containing protein
MQAGQPDAAAIRDGKRTWSYQELGAATRCAATLLADVGIGPGNIVGVGGLRAAEVVIGFLACDLLGAVYLPIEYTWPAKRIRDVLTGSRAAALFLTGPGAAGLELAGAAAGVRVVSSVDIAGCAEWTEQPRDEDGTRISYVLYTSGSTGTPKGAVVECQGMINHLVAKVRDLGLTESDRVAQTAPLGFDISVWQMLAPLLAGGETHIVEDAVAQDPQLLLPFLAERGITVAELVPTLLRLLLDAIEHMPESRLALRWMVATGEELPPGTAARFTRIAQGVRLMNAYGPTECSDDVTHFVVGEPEPHVQHLPIGGPVANTSLYVLRCDGQEWVSCPPGESGELFVGGVGVGRGYLADADRTRGAFFRDPFADTPTGRLYRTGDAVVALPNGVVEYRGRVDRQVKIAGFRMEPAEIEAVLTRHPRVTTCAVTVSKLGERRSLVARETRVGTSSSGELIAFVCVKGDCFPPAELRDYLADRLPLPMVPHRYLLLSELPLTTNGKVDYRALAALAARSATAEATILQDLPVGDAETAIAEAMAEVLGVPWLGRDGSFLALGGDSLSAVRLVARLREAGYNITVRDVLLGSSPREVATRAKVAADRSHEVAAEAGTGHRCRPLTPQQSGVYFHWKLEPDNPYYNYQGTIRLTGAVDRDRLARAWKALLTENPGLLARFLDDGDTPTHEYPRWIVRLPQEIDLSGLPEAERERRYRADAHAEAGKTFDLLGEQILRVLCYRMHAADLRLLITTHEIMLDGWGTTVLCHRLSEFYADPDATVDPGRYDRYLDWQHDHLASDEMRAAGEYWARQLSSDLPVLRLPSDAPRPPRPTYRGGIVEELVDASIAGRIRALGGELGVTPFMMFLAAYSLALSYFSGADEIIVGAPMANRERAEQLDVAAFMLNMLPFRVPIDYGLTGRRFLRSVRKTVMDGYAAAEYPFGWMLRDMPGTLRTVADTPVFQTMLNVITYPSELVEADGVTFEFTEMESGFVKYDCSLFVQAHGWSEMLAQLDYHVDVMSRDTAKRILESTVLGLRALAETPDTPLTEIDLLPPGDRALLADFTVGR